MTATVCIRLLTLGWTRWSIRYRQRSAAPLGLRRSRTPLTGLSVEIVLAPLRRGFSLKAAQSAARPGRCCRAVSRQVHLAMMHSSSISGLWIEGGASRLEINHAGARGRRVTRSILHRDNPSLRQLPSLESARFINELAAIALRTPQLHRKSPVRSLCHAIFIGGHTGQYGHLQSGPPDCTVPGGKPFCFLIGIVSVMTLRSRCVVASPRPALVTSGGGA